MQWYTMILVLAIISLIYPRSDTDLQNKIQPLRLEIEQLKQENQKLDREIARVDSLKGEEAARFSKLEKNYAQDLERRRSEIKELKQKMQEINSQIQRENAKQAGYRNKMDEHTAREKALVKSLIAHCEKLEEDIKSSLPWQLEIRMERVRVLKRDLESGTANLEEGFNRLNALYSQEIKSGDEVAIFDRPVTRNDGEVINAQILKIGSQWLVYADEEGKKYGVLQRIMSDDTLKYKWKEDLSFAEREAIRDALDVKTAKKPPKLVTLPLSLALDSKGQKKGGK